MTVSIPAVSAGAKHIEFFAKSTSATVTGRLDMSGSNEYVLRALEGQTMSIEMSFSEGLAILAVWGADGSVLLSDPAEVSTFQKVLPATQDYYILVKGRSEDGGCSKRQFTQFTATYESGHIVRRTGLPC